tara:strand:- start:652 stop:2016 length:1365 start_codon:yes stop_codon:yes gene_type:complete
MDKIDIQKIVHEELSELTEDQKRDLLHDLEEAKVTPARVSKAFTKVADISKLMILNVEKYKSASDSNKPKFKKIAGDLTKKKKAAEAEANKMIAQLDRDVELSLEGIRKVIDEEYVKLKEKEGVPHYTKDGKEWTGPMHKMPNGKLMTQDPHNDDSEELFHKEDLTEYGGSEFSKITSLQNYLTIDLDKFEKGLKDSKHKAIYKKARKQFMRTVSDVAFEHSKLHEGTLNEALNAPKKFTVKKKIKVDGNIYNPGIYILKKKKAGGGIYLNTNNNEMLGAYTGTLQAANSGFFLEGKLNEEDYKYKKYVSKAFNKISDAMFEFRNAMGVKQLGQADPKLKKRLEAMQAEIFALRREMKSKGLTESEVNEATDVWKMFDAKQKLYGNAMDIENDLKNITATIKQLYKNMEQEAEPEGGKVADKYGKQLDKYEKMYKQRKSELKKVFAKIDKMEQY